MPFLYPRDSPATSIRSMMFSSTSMHSNGRETWESHGSKPGSRLAGPRRSLAVSS